MTDLVSKIFINNSPSRPVQSGNGLALFCAFVCILTCGYSIVSSHRQEPAPAPEFFEMAAELRARSPGSGPENDDFEQSLTGFERQEAQPAVQSDGNRVRRSTGKW